MRLWAFHTSMDGKVHCQAAHEKSDTAQADCASDTLCALHTKRRQQQASANRDDEARNTMNAFEKRSPVVL